MIRKETLRLLLCDYQRTARYYTIYRTFKHWSSDDFTTILRLSAGRSYDYSSRNATTIADLYWLSGESPKRDTAASRQWFRAARRAPAAGLTRCALTADQCQIASRRAWAVSRPPPGWHGLRYAAPSGMDPRQWRTPAPLYIPYYNRRLR